MFKRVTKEEMSEILAHFKKDDEKIAKVQRLHDKKRDILLYEIGAIDRYGNPRKPTD